MFIEEYLVELRRERFAPAAILRYLRQVAARTRADWLANPNAVRSVWAVAVVYFAAAFLACVGMALAWALNSAARTAGSRSTSATSAATFMLRALARRSVPSTS